MATFDPLEHPNIRVKKLNDLVTRVDALGAPTATNTTFTPTGNVAATNVQAAIAELDSEKVAKAGDTMTGALAGTSASFSSYMQADTYRARASTGEVYVTNAAGTSTLLYLSGSQNQFFAGGNAVATVSATGLSVTGVGTFSGQLTASDTFIARGQADILASVDVVRVMRLGTEASGYNGGYVQFTGAGAANVAGIKGTFDTPSDLGRLRFYGHTGSAVAELGVWDTAGLAVTGNFAASGTNNHFGPSTGAAADNYIYRNNTNFYNYEYFRSWAAGVPQTDALIFSYRGQGLYLDGFSAVNIRPNGTLVAGFSTTGLALTGAITASGTVTAEGANGFVLYGPDALNYNISLSGTDVRVKSATSISLITGGVVRAAATATGLDITGEITATGTAWTAYTPTVTPANGAFTTVSASGKYKQLGKTMFFRANIIITTNGTANTAFTVSLPATPTTIGDARHVFACSETTTGVLGKAHSGGGDAYVTKYDGLYLGADGYIVNISGTYEVA